MWGRGKGEGGKVRGGGGGAVHNMLIARSPAPTVSTRMPTTTSLRAKDVAMAKANEGNVSIHGPSVLPPLPSPPPSNLRAVLVVAYGAGGAHRPGGAVKAAAKAVLPGGGRPGGGGERGRGRHSAPGGGGGLWEQQRTRVGQYGTEAPSR